MRLAILASLMLCSTAAQAAPARGDTDADAAARRQTDPKSKAAAMYDFENDSVTGDALSPDHEGIRSKTTVKFESMIRVRMHFIPQMLQMAQDV